MIIAKNDEEERSKIWRIVIVAATLVVLFVICFFVIRIFVSNPLLGTWKNADSDIQLTIKRGGNGHIAWKGFQEGATLDLDVTYRLNRDLKVITFSAHEDALEKAAKKSGGKVTVDGLESSLRFLLTSFDYSLNGGEMSLTEREYGEQMIYEKQ